LQCITNGKLKSGLLWLKKEKKNEWNDYDQARLSSNRFIGNKAGAFVDEMDKHERQQYRESGYREDLQAIEYQRERFAIAELVFFPNGELDIRKTLLAQIKKMPNY
jgi:hypothetical protein